ncbi:MAG: IMPACT family protein [Mycoplasmatales bacterium]
MKTIVGENIYQMEIKRSEFICYLKKIDTIIEAKKYLILIKQKHPDASHHCSAYIIEQNKKADDDGEPTGTAGVPILNVLEQHQLQNVICIVVRYFGGIKLGAGGLIRAYAKITSQTINSLTLINLVVGEILAITTDFTTNDKLKYYLTQQKIPIIKTSYTTEVNYLIKVPQDLKAEILTNIKAINYLIEIQKKSEILMEEYEK